jgi:ribonucleoside-diphosphate reductase alpha chain
VKKRDGRVVDFDKNKIAEAIWNAAKSVGGKDKERTVELADKVAKNLEKRFRKKMPSVEDVQDAVEKILIEEGHAQVAKSFILYRDKRARAREAKALLGVKDEHKLSLNAIKVLASRYLKKDENRKIIESTDQLFRRVAHSIASVDKNYPKYKKHVKRLEEDFYDVLTNLEFLPNSPTLMNAGTDIGQLSACFVLPVDDDMEGIFDAVKNTALIHKSGGGTGFSFSRIRPKGDVVKSTGGVASGPLSFMRVFNTATEVIKQGGKRRGANMGVLRVDHPDILEFITSKEKEGTLNNFNISIAVTDKFMRSVEKNDEYDLINPRSGKPSKRIPGRAVFNLMVMMAWKNGEPGVIFIDKMNNDNPTPHVGEIESTNPCGEQPLLSYESCNLGSINLAKMTTDSRVDWEKLGRVVRLAVHFLDNVIDANKFPMKDIEKMTGANRKIGLGVMGFADMLIKLGIPYNSEKAIKISGKLMKFIQDEGRKMSEELGLKKGSFENFRGSTLEKKYKAMRNATITTVAPTGTISVIAGCSSGIEPIFAISYIRNVADSLGHELIEVNPIFEKAAIEKGVYSEDLMKEIAQLGSIQDLKKIPEDLRKVFVTALDITPEWHVRIQAAFQKYTDNAVSKTINFPNFATPHDVEKAFMLAWRLGCKGITIYRYGSREKQVLTISNNKKGGARPQFQVLDSTYDGGCSHCSL